MAHQNRDGVDSRLLEHIRGCIRAARILGLLEVDRPCNLGESSKPEGASICGITPCPGSPPLACRSGSTQEPLKSCCHLAEGDKVNMKEFKGQEVVREISAGFYPALTPAAALIPS